MILGFDIDGVLIDLFSFQIKYGNKFFKNKYNSDYTKMNIKDIFNCTKEEQEKFWVKYIWKYCITEPARENASITLKKLREEGNQIYIISSRVHTMEDNIVGYIFRKMVIDWLIREGIPYDKIFFCREEDKYNVCKNNNVEIMFEDTNKNIKAVESVCTPIRFRAPYNNANDDVINISEIEESYNIVNELKKQKELIKVKEKKYE